jgi:hypothetical protein
MEWFFTPKSPRLERGGSAACGAMSYALLMPLGFGCLQQQCVAINMPTQHEAGHTSKAPCSEKCPAHVDQNWSACHYENHNCRVQCMAMQAVGLCANRQVPSTPTTWAATARKPAAQLHGLVCLHLLHGGVKPLGRLTDNLSGNTSLHMCLSLPKQAPQQVATNLPAAEAGPYTRHHRHTSN